MLETIVKIYLLYGIHGNDTKFYGRYASKHRAEAAARGLGLTNYFFEEEAKEDEFGGYVNINAALKSRLVR